MHLPAYSSTKHTYVAHEIRVAQQAKFSCDVEIDNLEYLKAGIDVLLDNFLNILDRMNLKCGMYSTQAAYQAIDMIQGDFIEKYNFYMVSCAISPSAFLFEIQ